MTARAPWRMLRAACLLAAVGLAQTSDECEVRWARGSLGRLEALAASCERIRVVDDGSASAGEGIDAFLAPRVRWWASEEVGGATTTTTLARRSADARWDQFGRLLECALHPAGPCRSVRVASHPGGGGFFGMHMIGLAKAFEASVARRVPTLATVPADWGYGNASDGRCEGLGCYFLPSTTCEVPRGVGGAALLEPCGKKGAARHVERAAPNGTGAFLPELPCRDAVRESLRQEPGCWRTAGALEAATWQFAESAGMPRPLFDTGGGGLASLLVAALRPNSRTRRAVAARVDAWLETVGGAAWRGKRRCAAVHVRHGDKLTEVWLKARPRDVSFNLTLDDYVAAALGDASSEGDAILLMTDDRDILDAAPRAASDRGVPVFSVAAGRPLQSTRRINRMGLGAVKHQGGCGRSVKMAKRAAARRGDPPPPSGTAPRIRAPPICALDYLRDPRTGEAVGAEELLQWMVAWRLMADCDRFVGKPMESLFARFIFVFVCVARGACPELRAPGRGAAPEDLWKDAY